MADLHLHPLSDEQRTALAASRQRYLEVANSWADKYLNAIQQIGVLVADEPDSVVAMLSVLEVISTTVIALLEQNKTKAHTIAILMESLEELRAYCDHQEEAITALQREAKMR